MTPVTPDLPRSPKVKPGEVGRRPNHAARTGTIRAFLHRDGQRSTGRPAANTISQDGDALLPLLALETRSAFVATLITTVPAVLVGTCLLLLS